MPALPWLDETLYFPDPQHALSTPAGLLCAGGDLSPERLIAAYTQGVFPWYSEGQPILWWSPDPRCILEFKQLHISKSMRRILNDPTLSYTFDTCFTDVIHACAAPRAGSDETWITSAMIQAYCDLHELDVAHSIEVWRRNKLVGGLYGISLGQCFFGESMFSRESNTSKYAFIKLAHSLEKWGCRLFDCQLPNPHLTSLGASSISQRDFLERLKESVDAENNFTWS